MPSLPRPALAVGLLWILACAAWFVSTVRKARIAPGSHGYPGRYPGLLLNGIGLLALTPVVSAIQYIATNHRYFWGGASVIFTGLILIGCHFILARRPADWEARPTATTSREKRTGFREKSAMLQIVAILVVYGVYGVRLWDFWRASAGPVTVIAIAALIAITIWMIIIGIASHIALVLYMRPEMPDERDRLIDLRGSRNAYFALAAGVWCLLLLAIADPPHGLLFYAIMATFALAEIVRLGSQLFYYRFGA